MNTNTPQNGTNATQVSATPIEVPTAAATAQPMSPTMGQASAPVSHGTSEDTKTLVTVLLLIFAFPIGAIVMLFWPKWKWWVKLLVLLPGIVISFFIAVFMLGALIAVNPSAAIKKAECVKQCSENYDSPTCVKMCSEVNPDSTDATMEDSTTLESSGMPEESMVPATLDDGSDSTMPVVPVE